MLHDSLGFALDDDRIRFADNAGAKNTPLVVNQEKFLAFKKKSKSNVAKFKI
ncbi:unnamed protein product [Brassica rapa subsp. trilocularis]